MILQILSILIFFTLFSTTFSHPQKSTLSSSPKQLNCKTITHYNLTALRHRKNRMYTSEKANPNPNGRNSISFSTQVYDKRRSINHISSNTSAFSSSKLHIDLHPIPNRYLVIAVGIGRNSTSTPMLTTELLVDTGSSLTWLQSIPCDMCYAQGDFPFYNSSASKTFNPSYCNEEICNTIEEIILPKCEGFSSPLDPCSYNIQYFDGSNTSGVIGTETFYFQDDNFVEHVPFGLGTSNYQSSLSSDSTPGVVGLKHGYGTLLNKLGVKKFSHCFPRNEEDIGTLNFGDTAKIIGVKLALDTTSMFYEAPLTNVYLSGERIPVEEDALPEAMVFDSGTPWSILTPKVYDAIKEAIIDALGKHKPLWDDIHLCYKIMDLYSIDLDEVAKLTFEFRYSTKIDLFSFQLWHSNNEQNIMCLGFHRGNPGDLIFGNHLMREVNVGYTLDEHNLAMYFNRQHCSR